MQVSSFVSISTIYLPSETVIKYNHFHSIIYVEDIRNDEEITTQNGVARLSPLFKILIYSGQLIMLFRNMKNDGLNVTQSTASLAQCLY